MDSSLQSSSEYVVKNNKTPIYEPMQYINTLYAYCEKNVVLSLFILLSILYIFYCIYSYTTSKEQMVDLDMDFEQEVYAKMTKQEQMEYMKLSYEDKVKKLKEFK